IYTTDGDPDRGAEEPTRAQVPVPGEAASQLISIFLQQNNWQPENLEKFEANWQKIGPNERQAAVSLPVMNRLKNAIYKQILEERAMMAVGDADSARQKQQLLVEFAQRIGINDPAIAVDP
ncbi:MAG: hypothetical protein R3318_05525, partial [Gammaproteobacteria bacterium]|nr:hypothetical protein [Gammaproteobacteria bacterium]